MTFYMKNLVSDLSRELDTLWSLVANKELEIGVQTELIRKSEFWKLLARCGSKIALDPSVPVFIADVEAKLQLAYCTVVKPLADITEHKPELVEDIVGSALPRAYKTVVDPFSAASIQKAFDSYMRTESPIATAVPYSNWWYQQHTPVSLSSWVNTHNRKPPAKGTKLARLQVDMEKSDKFTHVYSFNVETVDTPENKSASGSRISVTASSVNELIIDVANNVTTFFAVVEVLDERKDETTTIKLGADIYTVKNTQLTAHPT